MRVRNTQCRLDLSKRRSAVESRETALDVVAYAAQIAAQLGAHIIKVKLPTDHVEHKDMVAVYDNQGLDRARASVRVEQVMSAAFAGISIVVLTHVNARCPAPCSG